MVGVKFDEMHSYFDFGLILTSKSIESPKVKEIKVDVEGADGILDLTDFWGEPKFENRKIIFNFAKVQKNSDFIREWSVLQNALNGRKMKITLDEESEFYYYGRISMQYTRDKCITNITIECDCEPYKLKHIDTVVTTTGTQEVTLYNQRKRVSPTIITDSATRVVFNSKQYVLSAGTFVIPEIQLSGGYSTIKIVTDGTVTFKYQEGGL